MLEPVKQSLTLDRRFIKVSRWSKKKKLSFLFSKYLSISKHFYTPFILGKSSISFNGKDLFFDSKFGLAGYQSMLSRHQYMIQIAGIKDSDVKTVIDCGANVGFFSLMIHDVFPKAVIYAIEPVPSTLKCLEKNTHDIPQVHRSAIAVSDKEGHTTMSFDKDESVTSQISEKGDIKVKMTTLDKYCKDEKISEIDILKIDTESFEAHVLRGSKRILENTRYIFLEVSMREHGNYTITSLLSLLYSKNYNFQLVAYRNYTNKGEGKIEIMDCLFKNLKSSS